MKGKEKHMSVKKLELETGLNYESLWEMFVYLFSLRDSGETNMWLASSYLRGDFDLEKPIASKIAVFWIKNCKALEAEFARIR